MRVARERDRVVAELAADLHDGPLQILIGLQLLREARASPGAVVTSTDLKELAGHLNEAAGSLRRLITERDAAASMGRNLGESMQRVSPEASRHLGFVPETRFDAAVIELSDPSSVRAAAFIVYELPANVARHAHATRVMIAAQLCEGLLLITVTDDDCGVSAGLGSAGITNLNG